MKYLTQKELKKFFQAIEKDKNYPYWLRDSCLFQLGYLCALRVNEISRMKIEHFNDQTGEMYCPRLKKSRANTIRLDEPRVKLLKRYLKSLKKENPSQDQELLFLSKKGNPISDRRIRQLMQHYAVIARIPLEKAHPHALKHSIAVHLAESGADVKELQNYLGHKNVQNTMIYFEFTTKQQDAFYQKIKHNSQIVAL